MSAVALAPGSRVRVSLRSGATAVGGGFSPARGGNRVLVGALGSADARALVIRPRHGDAARVPVAEVSRLEVSRGPGACRGARRVGCVVGLGAAGLVVGGLVGAAVGNATEPADCYECYHVFGGIVLGGLAGATIGTITGALVGRERWQRVPLRRAP